MYSGYDRNGEWYQLYQIGFGGIPGKPFGDGPDGHSLWPSFTNVPNEFLESYFPLRIETYETIADSGGPGKNRGGNALRIGYRFLEPGEISIHDDRWLTYPWGANGGLPGKRGTKILQRADGTQAAAALQGRSHQGGAGRSAVLRHLGRRRLRRSAGARCRARCQFDVEAGLVTARRRAALRRGADKVDSCDR